MILPRVEVQKIRIAVGWAPHLKSNEQIHCVTPTLVTAGRPPANSHKKSWEMIVNPYKFDTEMTEASGITGNELCLVLIVVAVWKHKYCSSIFALSDCFYNLFVRHLTLEGWSKCRLLPTIPAQSNGKTIPATDYPCTIKIRCPGCKVSLVLILFFVL